MQMDAVSSVGLIVQVKMQQFHSVDINVGLQATSKLAMFKQRNIYVTWMTGVVTTLLQTTISDYWCSHVDDGITENRKHDE